MSTVLVVDDSPSDRNLVAEFLAADGDLEVGFAADGDEALKAMEKGPPNVVVTDLLMPRMDGFELVEAVNQRFPAVPVILMTSSGSEEVASRALHRGAASYVPKHALRTTLLSTIRGILEITAERRIHTRLLDCMTQDVYRFVLGNDRSIVASLVHFLQEGVARMGVCDANDRMRVGIALEEALLNALYHGNLEVDSALREKDNAAFESLAEERRQSSTHGDRQIYVTSQISRDRAVFTIRDEGLGFDPQSLPDPTDPANLEKVSGRGILLMRTFMDEVAFNQRGNEVTMTKHRKSAEEGGG